MLPHIPFPGVARLLFAANSRSSPDRSSRVLKYEPRGLGFLDSLEDDPGAGLAVKLHHNELFASEICCLEGINEDPRAVRMGRAVQNRQEVRQQ